MLQTPDWNPAILEEAGITEMMIKGLGVELAEYLVPFRQAIKYAGQDKHMEMFVKGFMSDLEYKSAEPIALRYGTSVRGAQRFLTSGKTDTAMLEVIYQKKLSEAIASPGGMITIDECGEPKKGNLSVGVARQYCGALGKTDNCQVGVYVGYTTSVGYGLINRRLYMPEKWFDDDHADVRVACDVPEDLAFKTKPQIATEMLNEVSATGLFPARWVGADCVYGMNKEFIAAIPEDLWYFADIQSGTLIFTRKPEMVAPEYSGRGRRDLKPRPSVAPMQVKALADDDTYPWSKVHLGEGAKGPIFAYEKCLRVIKCEEGLPTDTVWLYIRKLDDGTCKFSFSNAPADTDIFVIRDAALMRWPIEQCFLECKNELGLDHCEARSWKSWHRHTMLVLMAHLFLTTIRLKYKKNPQS